VRIHPDRSGRGPDCPRLSRNQRARENQHAVRRFNFKRCPSDTSSLSPFAQLAGAFQQLQQADPAAYAKLTRQIATSLQSESQTAQSQGNSGVAGELSQLANDFTTASQTGQLPNLQDLAQAVGGGATTTGASGAHGDHHHHHSQTASSDSSPASDSSASDSSTTSTSSILLQTLSSAGIGVSSSCPPRIIFLR
jgi:hypothetical protein